MLPEPQRAELGDKPLLDFGLGVEPGRFAFHDTHCVVPSSLVLAYALAVATSGQAARILMAGFDGYPAGDARNDEVEAMLAAYAASGTPAPTLSITPTSYKGLAARSVYGL
jgi:4-hydroxy 2-oxovalerate aldolase